MGLSNIPEVTAKSSFIRRVCVTERKRVFVGVWLACCCEKCASVGVKCVSQLWITPFLYKSNTCARMNSLSLACTCILYIQRYKCMIVQIRHHYTTNPHRHLHWAYDCQFPKNGERVHFSILIRYTIEQYYQAGVLIPQVVLRQLSGGT